jgi:hypothetical protein
MSIIHNILFGTSLNYIAIWADVNANINTGKLYVATTGADSAFSVVDLQNNVVLHAYSTSMLNVGDTTLANENIVDINISTTGI